MFPLSPLYRYVIVCTLLAGLTLPGAFGESPARRRAKPRQKPATVELFDGIKRGVLKVRVIPGDEFVSKVRITNTLKAPVSIELPKAVAAVHVLKQFIPPGGLLNDPNDPNSNGNNQNQGNGQTVGGQFGGGYGQGNGIGNFGFNQGLFSIPAKRTREIRLNTVCLQYGKPAPRLKMTYRLRPVETVVSDPALRRLLAGYNPRQTHHMTMQAAAWHLADKLTWRQLQAKQRRRIGFRPRRLFSRKQLNDAYKLVESAQKGVKVGTPRTLRTSLP
ncbi:MAG: hypothetical protein ACE5KM_04440 [Planctomycetaceae bacterium]